MNSDSVDWKELFQNIIKKHQPNNSFQVSIESINFSQLDSSSGISSSTPVSNRIQSSNELSIFKRPDSVNNGSIFNQSIKRKIELKPEILLENSNAIKKLKTSILNQKENIFNNVTKYSPFGSPLTPNIVRNIDKQNTYFRVSRTVNSLYCSRMQFDETNEIEVGRKSCNLINEIYNNVIKCDNTNTKTFHFDNEDDGIFVDPHISIEIVEEDNHDEQPIANDIEEVKFQEEQPITNNDVNENESETITNGRIKESLNEQVLTDDDDEERESEDEQPKANNHINKSKSKSPKQICNNSAKADKSKSKQLLVNYSLRNRSKNERSITKDGSGTEFDEQPVVNGDVNESESENDQPNTNNHINKSKSKSPKLISNNSAKADKSKSKQLLVNYSFENGSENEQPITKDDFGTEFDDEQPVLNGDVNESESENEEPITNCDVDDNDEQQITNDGIKEEEFLDEPAMTDDDDEKSESEDDQPKANIKKNKSKSPKLISNVKDKTKSKQLLVNYSFEDGSENEQPATNDNVEDRKSKAEQSKTNNYTGKNKSKSPKLISNNNVKADKSKSKQLLVNYSFGNVSENEQPIANDNFGTESEDEQPMINDVEDKHLMADSVKIGNRSKVSEKVNESLKQDVEIENKKAANRSKITKKNEDKIESLKETFVKEKTITEKESLPKNSSNFLKKIVDYSMNSTNRSSKSSFKFGKTRNSLETFSRKQLPIYSSTDDTSDKSSLCVSDEQSMNTFDDENIRFFGKKKIDSLNPVKKLTTTIEVAKNVIDSTTSTPMNDNKPNNDSCFNNHNSKILSSTQNDLDLDLDDIDNEVRNSDLRKSISSLRKESMSSKDVSNIELRSGMKFDSLNKSYSVRSDSAKNDYNNNDIESNVGQSSNDYTDRNSIIRRTLESLKNMSSNSSRSSNSFKNMDSEVEAPQSNSIDSSPEIIIRRKKKDKNFGKLDISTTDYTKQLRRSKRNRVKPLDYWRGERPIYKVEARSANNQFVPIQTIVGVKKPNELPFIKRKRKPTKEKPAKINDEKITKQTLSDILNLSIHSSKFQGKSKFEEFEDKCVKKFDNLTFEPSQTSPGIYLCTLERSQKGRQAFGMIKFDGYAKKCSVKNDYKIHFIVLYGAVVVKMENKPNILIKTGSYFQILPNIKYSIENVRKDEALLQFTVIRE